MVETTIKGILLSGVLLGVPFRKINDIETDGTFCAMSPLSSLGSGTVCTTTRH
jgi:hypothetical protein